MIQSLAGLKRRYIHPLLNNNNEILHSVIIYFTKKVKLCVKTHVDPFNILQNYNDQQYVKVTVVSITLSVFYICSHLCPDQQAYRHVPIKFEWANRWRPYTRKTRDRQTTVPSILAYNNIHFFTMLLQFTETRGHSFMHSSLKLLPWHCRWVGLGLAL